MMMVSLKCARSYHCNSKESAKVQNECADYQCHLCETDFCNAEPRRKLGTFHNYCTAPQQFGWVCIRLWTEPEKFIPELEIRKPKTRKPKLPFPKTFLISETEFGILSSPDLYNFSHTCNQEKGNWS